MANDSDAAMRETLTFTLEMADKILMSSQRDPMRAFINAVGTLAQVIHIITPDDRREDALQSMPAILRKYLAMLDEIIAPDPTIRR
jgi:hypothetical protein